MNVVLKEDNHEHAIYCRDPTHFMCRLANITLRCWRSGMLNTYRSCIVYKQKLLVFTKLHIFQFYGYIKNFLKVLSHPCTK